jgi:hypothetical protein
MWTYFRHYSASLTDFEVRTVPIIQNSPFSLVETEKHTFAYQHIITGNKYMKTVQ